MILSANKVFVMYGDDTLHAFKVRDGIICESYVPDLSELKSLVDATIDIDKRNPILPTSMVSNTGRLVYFIKPGFRKINKRDKKEVYLPGMILVLQNDELYSFATKVTKREDLKSDTPLFHIPLPNIYTSGLLCYGEANQFTSSKYSYQVIEELLLETLFGVDFTLHSHNVYTVNFFQRAFSLGYKQPWRWMKFWNKELISNNLTLSAWL